MDDINQLTVDAIFIILPFLFNTGDTLYIKKRTIDITLTSAVCIDKF